LKLLYLSVILLVAGCATSPEATYLQAERTFQTAVWSLIQLKNNGDLTNDDINKLTPVINDINSSLSAWKDVLIEGKSADAESKRVVILLRRLLELKQEIDARDKVQ
jgi:hypothetical protein